MAYTKACSLKDCSRSIYSFSTHIIVTFQTLLVTAGTYILSIPSNNPFLIKSKSLFSCWCLYKHWVYFLSLIQNYISSPQFCFGQSIFTELGPLYMYLKFHKFALKSQFFLILTQRSADIQIVNVYSFIDLFLFHSTWPAFHRNK